jgi:hypothetical protein
VGMFLLYIAVALTVASGLSYAYRARRLLREARSDA